MRYAIAVIILVFLLSINAGAQEQIRKSVLGNGGTAATNGTLAIGGTVGQALIGISQDTQIRDHAGFWFEYILDNPVSVSETPGNNTSLGVSPHPVTSSSTIQYTPRCEGAVRIELFSLVGEKIQTIYNDYATQSLRLNFKPDELASGTYSLRVSSSCGEQSMLVIIQH